MRLLVVEDDEDAATYIRQGLAQAGHTVDVVGNGRDGVALAVREDYDMVILDRMLPALMAFQSQNH